MLQLSFTTVFCFIAITKISPCLSVAIGDGGYGFCPKNQLGLNGVKSFNLPRRLIPWLSVSEATEKLCALQNNSGFINVNKLKLNEYTCKAGLIFNVKFDDKATPYTRFYCVKNYKKKRTAIYQIIQPGHKLIPLGRHGFKQLRNQIRKHIS